MPNYQPQECINTSNSVQIESVVFRNTRYKPPPPPPPPPITTTVLKKRAHEFEWNCLEERRKRGKWCNYNLKNYFLKGSEIKAFSPVTKKQGNLSLCVSEKWQSTSGAPSLISLTPVFFADLGWDFIYHLLSTALCSMRGHELHLKTTLALNIPWRFTDHQPSLWSVSCVSG